jgi:hypothetical protein
MVSCPDTNDPNALWSFCPNFGADIFFSVCFGIISIVHLVQSIVYRKLYCCVIVIAALLQTGTYVVRGLSIINSKNESLYSTWFVLILVAPLWINAFIYMVVGRMVYNFLPNHTLGKIKAWRFGMWFVILDIV